MYKEKKIIALIPARGGSKGIKNKNIRMLGGKPLIAWTIEAAQKSKYLDEIILSSDSMDIIKIAQNKGCKAPFVRPKQLALDESSSIDVIIHALDQVKDRFDYLLLLQPTSPFRTDKHIDEIIEECINLNAQAIVSISKIKKHPSFLFQLLDRKLLPYLPAETQLRRQDMPPSYEHNGALYLSTVDFIRSNKTYLLPTVYGFEMHGVSNLDIDTQEDWDYAEYLIKNGKV